MAQLAESTPGSVTGNGVVTIEQKPTKLRLIIQISTKGKSLKEALGKMKDRRDAAALQLNQLGAIKESVRSTDPVVSPGKTPQQMQMERYMLQQARAQGRKTKANAAPPSVTVDSMLTAEWNLKASSHDELLLFAKDLQDKVTAADLAGRKDLEPKTAEEKELAEELSSAAEEYGGYDGNEQKPGEPQFVYLAVISEKQKADALKAAFAKAKTQAETLAAAAGVVLGSLDQLHGTVGSSPANNYESMGYPGNFRYQMAIAQQMSGETNEQENEASAPQPGPVKFQISVMANFQLKK
jgi:hypothetical protein